MSESLKDAGLNALEVFSWNELIDSINELRTMCMVHGILNTPIMLLNDTAATKYFADKPELLEKVLYTDRTPLIHDQFHEVPQYKNRMLDALQELYEST